MMTQEHTKPQDNDAVADDSSAGSAGRGWHGDSEGHARAGRKGGTAVSSNREHMAQIGSRGGKARGQKRATTQEGSDQSA